MGEIDKFCKAGGERCKGKKTSSSGYCYTMSESVRNTKEFLQSFPEVTVRIGGETISWSPSEYFVVDLNDPTKYCFGIEHQVY